RPLLVALPPDREHELSDVEARNLAPDAEEHPVQIAAEIARALIAARGIRGERPIHDGLELGRNPGVELAKGRHVRLLHHANGLVVALSQEQPSTREELPEDDADREDVGARVYRLPLSRLRRQIAELALDDAGLAVLELAVRFGEPEVHDLHLPVPRDEHVGG